MTIVLYVLIGLIVAGCAAAMYALQANRDQRAILTRVGGQADAAPQIPLLWNPQQTAIGRLAGWLRANTPESWSEAGDAASTLVHAGFDSPTAPLFYTTVRLASAVMLPLAAFALGPSTDARKLALSVAAALCGATANWRRKDPAPLRCPTRVPRQRAWLECLWEWPASQWCRTALLPDHREFPHR